MESDKIRDLIGKLFALATSSNEHEAAAAMEKAQELLLKHNLSEAEIRGRTGEAKAKVGAVEVLIKDGSFEWKGRLLTSIARANLVYPVLSARFFRVTLFGQQQNVAMVMDMYHWIVDQLERMGFNALRDYMQPIQQAGFEFGADGSVKQKPWKPLGGETEAAFLLGFFKAANGRIDTRLTEGLRKFSRDSAESMALVVTTGQELQVAVAAQFPNLHRLGSGYRGAGTDGLRAGRAAGDKVRLTRDPALSGAGGAPKALGAGR